MRLRELILRSKKDLDSDLTLLQQLLVNGWMTLIYLVLIVEWYKQGLREPATIFLSVIALSAPFLRSRLTDTQVVLYELTFALLLVVQVGQKYPATVLLLLLPLLRVTTMAPKHARLIANVGALGTLALILFMLSRKGYISRASAVMHYVFLLLGYFGLIELLDIVTQVDRRRIEILSRSLAQDPVATYDRFLKIQQGYEALRAAFSCKQGFIGEIAGEEVHVVLTDFVSTKIPRDWLKLDRFLKGFDRLGQAIRDRAILRQPYALFLNELPADHKGLVSGLEGVAHEGFVAFLNHYFPEALSFRLIRVAGVRSERDYLIGFLSSKLHLADETWPVKTQFEDAVQKLQDSFKQSDQITDFLVGLTRPTSLASSTSSQMAKNLLEFAADYLKADCGFIVLVDHEQRGGDRQPGLYFRTVATTGFDFIGEREDRARSPIRTLIDQLCLPKDFFEKLPGFARYQSFRLVGTSNREAGQAIADLYPESGYLAALSHINSSIVFPIEVHYRPIGYMTLHFRRYLQNGEADGLAVRERQVGTLSRAVVGNFIQSSAMLEGYFLPVLQGMFRRDFHGVHACLSELVNASAILDDMTQYVPAGRREDLGRKIRDLELAGHRVYHLLAGVAYLYGHKIGSRSKEFSLNDCIHNCIDMIKHSKLFAGQEIKYSPAVTDYVLGLDQYGFGSTITELIRNSIAAKATKIAVEVEGAGDGLAIRIVDNGRGIPPGLSDLVGQANVSLGGSSGVGLNLVKRFSDHWGIDFSLRPRNDIQRTKRSAGTIAELGISRGRLRRKE